MTEDEENKAIADRVRACRFKAGPGCEHVIGGDGVPRYTLPKLLAYLLLQDD